MRDKKRNRESKIERERGTETQRHRDTETYREREGGGAKTQFLN